MDTDRDLELLAAELAVRGVATSAELQAALGRSQPTLSRLLAALSARVAVLGRGRRTRYALLRPLLGLAAQQPLWWVDEAGARTRLGTLSLLGSGDLVHVQRDGGEDLLTGRLPWYLAPLKAQGFLGRLLARRLAAAGLPPDPEQWHLEATLFAAVQLHDAPGAVVLGDAAAPEPHETLPDDGARAGAWLDAQAADVARTLPAGSSAGGEQPKFLAAEHDGAHLLVKFTPPRGTPFGERWHDLLHAEALAAAVLAAHGVPAAAARLVRTAQRTYLLSPRFDRIGAHGRRHVVAVGAVHDAFVPGAYTNWALSCEALVRQNRLPAEAAPQARALLDFGRLIGNSDMHAGNLGLLVDRDGIASGRFALAPVYDMLPMRWRPDALAGGAADYAPFEPDRAALAGPARAPALEFWQRLAREGNVGAALRGVAAEMARRLAG